MLIILDGTGPASRDLYKAEFAAGFCKILHASNPGSLYFRGTRGNEPTSLAEYYQLMRGFFDVPKKAREAIAAATHLLKAHPSEPVYICGYSRGCASALWLAWETEWPITAMFLFDAVARTAPNGHDMDVVPRNVAAVYHAKRNPKYTRRYDDLIIDMDRRIARLEVEIRTGRAGNGAEQTLREMKAKVKTYEEIYPIVNNKARNGDLLGLPYFGFSNCATERQDATATKVWEIEHFMGSHGALGGMPWPDKIIENDREAVAKVRAWMAERLARHRLTL